MLSLQAIFYDLHAMRHDCMVNSFQVMEPHHHYKLPKQTMLQKQCQTVEMVSCLLVTTEAEHWANDNWE